GTEKSKEMADLEVPSNHDTHTSHPLHITAFEENEHFVRTGTLWTATAHVVTAVIGAGVLSLAWSVAQLGWVAGPAVMIVFALITYYSSSLLADCYKFPDPVTGPNRNYTYRDAVRVNLAFGENAPGNLFTGFGFYEPYWLVDFANACIVVHLVGAYQVFCQPLFAFIED
ncbi:hypothetical protein KI387_043187, partial [Taxus chinensis]